MPVSRKTPCWIPERRYPRPRQGGPSRLREGPLPGHSGRRSQSDDLSFDSVLAGTVSKPESSATRAATTPRQAASSTRRKSGQRQPCAASPKDGPSAGAQVDKTRTEPTQADRTDRSAGEAASGGDQPSGSGPASRAQADGAHLGVDSAASTATVDPAAQAATAAASEAATQAMASTAAASAPAAAATAAAAPAASTAASAVGGAAQGVGPEGASNVGTDAVKQKQPVGDLAPLQWIARQQAARVGAAQPTCWPRPLPRRTDAKASRRRRRR